MIPMPPPVDPEDIAHVVPGVTFPWSAVYVVGLLGLPMWWLVFEAWKRWA